jgi:hypothetical protein
MGYYSYRPLSQVMHVQSAANTGSHSSHGAGAPGAGDHRGIRAPFALGSQSGIVTDYLIAKEVERTKAAQ